MLKTARNIAQRARETVRGITDRRYRDFHAQRRISDLGIRRILAEELAETLPRTLREPIDSGMDLLGYEPVPDLVSASQVEEIREWFDRKLAYDKYRPDLGRFHAPGEVPSGTHIAEYSMSDVLAAPHLLSIANDPRVLALVESHLGAEPIIGSMRVWWSTPTSDGQAQATEFFHRDVDDLRFCKLFVYLTDVDEDTGPHTYCPGTHRMNILTDLRRLSDEEVEAAVGVENVIQFTGPAGTSFLEDTYGIHRGTPPRSKPRLLFQPLYTLRQVPYGPKRPLRRVLPSEAHLRPRVNSVFLRHPSRAVSL